MTTDIVSHSHPSAEDAGEPIATWPRDVVNREFTEANVNGIEMDYWSDLRSRAREFRGVVRTSVGPENDAFGLGERGRANQADVEPAEDMPDSQTRAQLGFGQQVREWLAALLIGITGAEAIRQGRHWTGGYIRRSYAEGLRFAERRLERAGFAPREVEASVLMDGDVHRRLLAQAYLFQSNNVQDIARDIERTLQRRVAEGLRDGWSPTRLADALVKEARAIEGSRMLTQARTEPLKAHNRAALARFRERGVPRVAIVNSDPCPECRPFAGNIYPIDDVPFGGPPFHPNCRGILVPAT